VTTTAPSGPPAIHVRQAERADLLAIYRIETEAFAQPWPFSAFERYLGEPGFLVATGDSVAGYVVADVVSDRGVPVGHIKDIAVHRGKRGEGVGGLLLARALAVLGSEGVQATKLEVRESNERAINLYRSYGFEYRTTVPGYYEDGEDALLLVRRRR